jgi:hypothetical protein
VCCALCPRVVGVPGYYLALTTAWCTQDYQRVHERSTSSNEDGLGDVSKRRFFLQAFSKGGRVKLRPKLNVAVLMQALPAIMTTAGAKLIDDRELSMVLSTPP